MASVKETTEVSSENSELAAVQQLVFSVGHLKFSLRGLSSMHLQSALHSQRETELPTRFIPLESNTVLENKINEVLSSKSDQSDQGPGACRSDEMPTFEDLELVHKKLQEEFEKRRNRFMTSLSNKCNQ